MRGLKDRVTVVAGAATGIGAATAERLAAEGARVVVGDLNAEGAQSTAKRIRDAGGEAIATPFDITDEESVKALLKSAVDTYGKLDGVHVNAADMSSAAQAGDTDVVDIDLARWDRTIEVNLRGHFLVARAAIPVLLSTGGGALVFTSSTAAFTGESHRVAYAVSKAGVHAIVRHISGRWGKEGIRANAVAPGVVLTESAVSVTTEEWRDMVMTFVNSPGTANRTILRPWSPCSCPTTANGSMVSASRSTVGYTRSPDRAGFPAAVEQGGWNVRECPAQRRGAHAELVLLRNRDSVPQIAT